MIQDDRLKVYIDQLRDGHVEEIHEDFAPEELGLNDAEISFTGTVHIDCEANIASHDLVLLINSSATALLPCSICNEPVEVAVSISHQYEVVPLAEIKGAIFYLKDLLRQAILLDTPDFAECCTGQCPQRSKLKQYFKEPVETLGNDDDEGYNPFADLKLNE